MAKRLFDILFVSCALLASAPLMLVAGLGIVCSSRGPIVFRAERVGRDGKLFTMFKFRTMHLHDPSNSSSITAYADSRVFPFGKMLRNLKIDELPQLMNVLRGEMSLVGPRPEDPRIVDSHYSVQDYSTLSVSPGLVSPGSLYNYTHGERLIDPEFPELAYVRRLLPDKMTLERSYLARRSMSADIGILVRTTSVLIQKALGRRTFPLPPELTTSAAGDAPNGSTFPDSG